MTYFLPALCTGGYAASQHIVLFENEDPINIEDFKTINKICYIFSKYLLFGGDLLLRAGLAANMITIGIVMMTVPSQSSLVDQLCLPIGTIFFGGFLILSGKALRDQVLSSSIFRIKRH
ncbi:MAG: hypothetical protein V4487_01150 [Chlamydiota bacterium]